MCYESCAGRSVHRDAFENELIFPNQITIHSSGPRCWVNSFTCSVSTILPHFTDTNSISRVAKNIDNETIDLGELIEQKKKKKKQLELNGKKNDVI